MTWRVGIEKMRRSVAALAVVNAQTPARWRGCLEVLVLAGLATSARSGLALGELESTTGASLTVLLTLNLTSVAGQEPVLAEDWLKA